MAHQIEDHYLPLNLRFIPVRFEDRIVHLGLADISIAILSPEHPWHEIGVQFERLANDSGVFLTFFKGRIEAHKRLDNMDVLLGKFKNRLSTEKLHPVLPNTDRRESYQGYERKLHTKIYELMLAFYFNNAVTSKRVASKKVAVIETVQDIEKRSSTDKELKWDLEWFRKFVKENHGAIYKPVEILTFLDVARRESGLSTYSTHLNKNWKRFHVEIAKSDVVKELKITWKGGQNRLCYFPGAMLKKQSAKRYNPDLIEIFKMVSETLEKTKKHSALTLDDIFARCFDVTGFRERGSAEKNLTKTEYRTHMKKLVANILDRLATDEECDELLIRNNITEAGG